MGWSSAPSPAQDTMHVDKLLCAASAIVQHPI